jgi:hypothetical protein
MANRNKNKGTYHEKWFVDWLTKAKIKAKRQPLSGSLGGEYSGDIKLELFGQELVGEVKYRDKSNFPSPFKVLEGRDIAFYKRRSGEPQTVVIMSGDQFLKLMENANGITDKDNQSAS